MSDKMEIKNTKGKLAGAIAWVIFIFWGINDSACLKAGVCGDWDLLLQSIIAVGMLGPSWIIGCLVSNFLEDRN
jgi:hypothetical protein